jgi:hypothetical protein
LPEITNVNLKKHLYYSIAPNCMRIDACADITIQAIDFTKAVKIYIELNPCQFILTVAFETITKSIILLTYDWGM